MSKGDYDNIPSKPVAVRKVASWVAGLMDASSYEELVGVPEEAMTPAERERVSRACEEIVQRLRRMGGAG